MIELERHIEIFLLNNDCVIVPGLGGFVAHHVDACYDDVENRFFPPMRTVGFNPKLDMNDSLLIHSYTEAYDLSYPEAENRIRQEVSVLKKYMERDGEYTLNNIGVLAFSGNGTYDFTPCEAGILTPSLYGLSSFEIDVCDNGKDIPAITVNTAPVKAEDIVMKEDDAAPADAEENGERTISIRVNAIRNAVAFIVAVIAFFLISTPLGSDKQPGVQMGKIENGVIYRLMPKDVTLGDIDNIKATDKAPATETTEKTDVKSQPVAAEDNAVETEAEQKEIQKDYYCIVLASRITKKNAEEFAAKLRKNGVDSATVLKERNGVKVIAGRYGKEKDAYAAMNSMKKDESFSDVWVYRVRN